MYGTAVGGNDTIEGGGVYASGWGTAEAHFLAAGDAGTLFEESSGADDVITGSSADTGDSVEYGSARALALNILAGDAFYFVGTSVDAVAHRPSPPNQHWMPNQPHATSARSTAGSCAPRTPNDARIVSNSARPFSFACESMPEGAPPHAAIPSPNIAVHARTRAS